MCDLENGKQNKRCVKFALVSDFKSWINKKDSEDNLLNGNDE